MIRIHKNLYINRERIGGVQLSNDETRIDVFRNDDEGAVCCSFGSACCDETKTVSAQFYDIVDQINQADSGHGLSN